jgi:hypothetical protein
MPISAVEAVMMAKVRIRVDFRPIRSPRWPATKAPRGRAMKPTPNVARAAIWEMLGSIAGKNRGPKTSAAAVAYTVYSYHSTTAPMVPENSVRRRTCSVVMEFMADMSKS